MCGVNSIVVALVFLRCLDRVPQTKTKTADLSLEAGYPNSSRTHQLPVTCQAYVLTVTWGPATQARLQGCEGRDIIPWTDEGEVTPDSPSV